VIGKFEGVFKRGLALFGPTWEQIKTYTNGQCYFDNSQFFAIEIRNGEVVGDNGIPVIKAETGLVGSPKRAEGVLEVEMLFEPRLVIGQAVKLESKINPIFDGIYVVSGLEHRGTISPVTAGQCITKASLWVGKKKFGDPVGYADAS
ncbi:MAG: hypothetical protein LBK99_19230, partial [Opitutaceae bacterium]|nr:hypothetical protein [Opitutaceae bacterium]